jgi:glycosyltransferase involved in cell wall biosynthesis
MPDPPLPLVSLAFPLYKSRRFLDIICENLETIGYPNLEYLISDRHSADDALDVLRARYGSDTRFRFFKARDELNWVEHFNFLLDQARGKYIAWLPHDDTYSENYVSRLVEALEQNADALAAMPSQRSILPGESERRASKPPTFSNTQAWNSRLVLRQHLGHRLYGLMHSLFRREPLIANNLWIRPTRDTNAADYVWGIALASRGRFLIVPDAFFIKRYYRESTHARWKLRTWRHTAAEIPIMKAYLVDPEASRTRRLRGWALVGAWGTLRFGSNFLDLITRKAG